MIKNNVNVVSVSDVLNEIKEIVEGHFPSLCIVGEVSNLSQSSSGHWYFTLSDKEASLSAALFRMDALRNLDLGKIKNGDKVYCLGPLGVYTRRGTFQIIVKKIIPYGVGDLKLQFEALKKKLALDGLFDIDKKKQVPKIPRRIAVITALNGAALRDFIQVFKRRCFYMNLLIVPATVQGDQAPQSILKALKKIEGNAEVEVVVLTRGGGSLEDLWAFNDENLVRAIASYPVPIISAVGHEVDYTLCDFAADLRAETPSAAAEMLTMPQVKILTSLSTSSRHLALTMRALVNEMKPKLHRCRPEGLSFLLNRLIGQLNLRLLKFDPMHRLNVYFRFHEYYMRLDDSLQVMKSAIDKSITHLKGRSDLSVNVLNSLNPKNVMKRGYVFLTDHKKGVVANKEIFDSLESNEKVQAHFIDGVGQLTKGG